MEERKKKINRKSRITLSGRIGGSEEDRNGWRAGWQAPAEACTLTTVRKGAQARSPINYNLDPPLIASPCLTHTFRFIQPSSPASYPPLVPLLCSYKSISSHSIPPPSPSSPAPLCFFLTLASFLLNHLPPFIVGSTGGVERSKVGRQEGENEAEAMNECLNETVNAFSQSGADDISCACRKYVKQKKSNNSSQSV